MSHHLTILTGASRGMGLAMAEQLLRPEGLLLCISRQQNPTLSALAAECQAPLAQWSQDLAEPTAAAQRLADWLANQAPDAWQSATLINNAGVLPAIQPLAAQSADGLARALRVGLEAPLLLTAAFLQATQGWGAQRKVLNISSGLGRYPMASQAAYCAAKAGMDHFTRCAALEEALQPNGARLVSLAPGVIDTDMQVQMRGAEEQAFPDRARFVQMQAEGQLSSPSDAAARVLAWLSRPDFGQHPVADVRDA